MPRIYKYLTTKVLGTISLQNQTHFILQDDSGFEINFPESLVRDNHLTIEPDNTLNITPGLYYKWFSETKYDVMQGYSDLLFKNFHVLYENRGLILKNKKYYKIEPDWLYSGGIFCGHFTYTIGSLFNHWENNTTLLRKEGWMYKISGSALSGANHYHTISVNEKTFGEGYVNKADGESWRSYLQIFVDLSRERRNSLNTNLKYTRQLITELNLT